MKTWKHFNTIVLSIFFLQIISVTAADAANEIMPLGDSITWDDRAGDSRTDGQRIAYRYRLWQLLTEAGYEIDFVGSQSTGFDIFPDAENEGHSGWTDDEILNGNPSDPQAGNLAIWLAAEQPQIVLLHIGTNGLDPSPDDVEAILDEIDAFSPNVWVVLARIINRSCSTDLPSPCPESQTTMNFNDNVEDMALDRVNNPTNPAFPDKIVIVDMEAGADIDYHLITDNPPGDMWDNLHPYETGVDSGYSKMANVWFSSLEGILPWADAGPDQNVNEFDTVELDASMSTDPKGGNLSYQWVQTAGTPLVDLIPDNQAIQPTFTAPDAGLTGKTLTFTLTVTDEDGLVSTNAVDITVAKIQPLADAGPPQTVNEFVTVTLDASGSVGVGLSYQWTQTAGTPIVALLPNHQAIKPTFEAPDVGASGEILTFELTVTDDDGVDSTATVNITVKTLPLADAGLDQEVTEGDTVTLDGSNSSGSDGMISYFWEQTAGTPQVTLSDETAAKPTFIAPQVGPAGESLTFKLTVTDDDGDDSTAAVNITVKTLPLANAGPDQGVTEGDAVMLDGSNSSGSDGMISYFWQQTAGTPQVTLSDETEAKPTFTAPEVDLNGTTLTFQLTVTDNDGQSHSDTMKVNVTDLAIPVADAGSDQDVKKGDLVTLDGTGSSDADGTIVTYLWEQTPAPTVTLTGADTPTATFTAPDVGSAGEILTFQLTVTDNDGQSHSDTMKVNVTVLAADAGDDQIVTEGDKVTLDGTGSSDSDGTITSYSWEQTGGTEVDLIDAASDTATFAATATVAPTVTFTAPPVGSAGETLTFELTVTDDDGLSSSDRTRVTVNGDDSGGGGGGGGGGGCFIGTAASGSPIALLHGKVLRALSSQFAGVNWKRLMPEGISLLSPRAEHATTPALMITMVVLINTWAAIVLRTRQKR